MAETELHALRVSRTYKAPRERVFKAWTDPRLLQQWWGAGPDFAPTVTEMDLRVGGAFKLGMRHTVKGSEHLASGVFLEVVVPERLVYSWQWQSAGAPRDQTQITVEFIAHGNETELILTHTLLPDQKTCKDHEMGWTALLKKMDEAFTQPA
jgi:uncharacterized protein YndB with AHSA1/START domain